MNVWVAIRQPGRVQIQRVTPGKNHTALDKILKFADVARPMVTAQKLTLLLADTWRRPAQFLCDESHQMRR